MDETEQKTSPKEICSIRIGFPVESDEQAIEYKKKVTAVLADIPEVQIQFSLMPIPSMPSSLIK